MKYALYIIDDSIIDAFEFKLWQNCRQVRFPPWVSHFRCYCFSSSSNRFERNIESSFPSFKLPFEAWNPSVFLRIVPLIGKSFIRVFLNESNSTFSKISFCLTLTFFLFMLILPNQKALIFSLFSGSNHVDIVFLGTLYFSVTFEGFVSNPASVIALCFSESDNLFLCKLAIFPNIQL